MPDILKRGQVPQLVIASNAEIVDEVLAAAIPQRLEMRRHQLSFI